MNTTHPSLRLTTRRLVMIAALTAAWCALWQRVSVANIASGVALAVGVLMLGVATEGRGRIRPVPLLRLVWLVLVDLVVSTVGVAKEIVTPIDRTDEAIIAIELQPEARRHFLLLVVAITVTPGTAVVDADPDTGTLYVHLLHLERRADVTAHVHRLADLVCQALPTGSGPEPKGLVPA